MNIDQYLNPQYGIMDYLQKQKRLGKISPSSPPTAASTSWRFIEAYGEHIEFCQIRLNYVDWTFQDAKGTGAVEASWNPCWIMELVCGGKLANLFETETRRLKEMKPDEELVAWLFRFLQSLPGITVTLSRMFNRTSSRRTLPHTRRRGR